MTFIDKVVWGVVATCALIWFGYVIQMIATHGL